MPRYVKVAPRRASKYLPNATHLGYSKYKASPGDMIVFRVERSAGESPDRMIGRVIGVIDETDRDGTDYTGKGALLVIAVSRNASFGMEMWVDLEDIEECTSPKHAAHFLNWFLNATPKDLMAYRNEDLETRKAAALPWNVKQDL